MSGDTSEKEVKTQVYRFYRPLHRPKANVAAIIILLLTIEWGVEWLTLRTLGIIQQNLSLDISYILCYISISLLFTLLFGHWLAILLIKLYQHYAPERIRRKCICQPSCSEYAIIAFSKYGMIKGGYKTYVRLFHTCRGNRYIIDNP